jgi:UDP-galactopyranose mutase
LKKLLIVGGGFAGCAAVHTLRSLPGYEITLIEPSGVLGAGVRTYFKGGHPFTFGPRHFLTQNERAFAWLNDRVPLRRCSEHEFRTYVETDSSFYSYPIHIDDVSRMPDSRAIEDELSRRSTETPPKTLEEYWVSSVGNTLYEKFVDVYSRKMWSVKNNNEIDDFGWSPKGVALKQGPRSAWDTAISAYPIARDGYNSFFDSAAEKVDQLIVGERVVRADYVEKVVYTDGGAYKYDVLVNTISPDILAEFRYGELPYMGRDIELLVLPVRMALPENVYFCYYAGKEPYTRVTEYKKFYRYDSEHTIISIEYPSRNGRHYPMPFKIEYQRADKYFSDMPEEVFSIGRAGSYRYSVDIDDCILQAIDIFEKLR